VKCIVVGKHERKGEAKLSVVETRLPHWIEFQGEKFNPATTCMHAVLEGICSVLYRFIFYIITLDSDSSEDYKKNLTSLGMNSVLKAELLLL